MIKFLIYIISLMTSIFAVSGLNINGIFKKNHNVEATMFIILITLSLTYLVANLIIDLTNISII